LLVEVVEWPKEVKMCSATVGLASGFMASS
jgi:hypothetical protein